MTLLTKSAFARLLGCVPSYVTKLKHEGLLVLQQGRVDVEATRAMIATAKGRRPDVASRWAEQRAANAAAASQAGHQGENAALPVSTLHLPSKNPLAGANGGPETPQDPAGANNAERNDIALRKARATMEREEALAEQERMTAARMRGDLIPKANVELAFKSIAAVVRSGLETQPDQLAPVIAPVADVQSVHSILVDAHRNLLTNLSEATKREAERLAREARTA